MYYSSYHRLLKAVAWLDKFGQHRRHQQPSKHPTVKDLELAERAVIRYIQHHAFPEEIRRIRKQEPVATGSALVQLDPFIDEHCINALQRPFTAGMSVGSARGGGRAGDRRMCMC